MDDAIDNDPFVLHVRTVTGAGGGPEKTILNSPRFLRLLGYKSACAYLHPPDDPGFEPLRDRALEAGAELISVPDRGISDFSIVRRLLRICRERNVAIWHGHDYKSDAIGLLLRCFHPMKLVSTVHGWGVRSWKTPLYHAVDRFALRHHDRVVCVSDELLCQCIKARIPIGRCSEIANGIDLSAYDNLPDRVAARVEFGIHNEHPLLIAVGRLSAEKGFDVLIRAVDQLIESGMRVNLLIAGNGPLLAKLEQLIASTGHDGLIRLLGHVADPRRLFAAADAFVLSSRSEGLPNVLLESLVCRVPVVATPVGAVPNVATDGEDALLVPVDDTDALTVALTRLLSNPSLHQMLAENGRRTVERQFSFATRMQKMAALYDSLLGRTRGTGSLPVDSPGTSDGQDSCPTRPLIPTHCVGTQNTDAPCRFELCRNQPTENTNPINVSLQRKGTKLQRFTKALRFSAASRLCAAVSLKNDKSSRRYSSVDAERPGERSDAEGESESRKRGNEAELRHEDEVATATLTKPAIEKSTSSPVAVRYKPRIELTASPETWRDYLAARGHAGFYQRAAWSRILSRGLQHEAVCLQALDGPQLVGVLPLMFVRSRLFGRFLVSLPYLNSAGVVADSPEIATALVDKAVKLADQLDVRYLELRHEQAVEHPALTEAVTDKVHMRLTLPATPDELWNSFKSKLRSQIRKPLTNERLSVEWGSHDILNEFYDVFTQNMRDLGTPPFSRALFAAMLDELPGDAEICVVRCDGRAIASGLLIHGPGVTEVPSASSLREFNGTAANMLLYWHLLSRAIERGQHTFDFGRSSKDSGTYCFKAQWGATEFPAVWQHYVREGSASDMRPNSGKYDLMINTWQKLPVWLTKLIGPSIVRGIP